MTLLDYILLPAMLILTVATIRQILLNHRDKGKVRMSLHQYRRLRRRTLLETGLMVLGAAFILAVATYEPGLATIATGVLVAINCVLHVAQTRLTLWRATIDEG